MALRWGFGRKDDKEPAADKTETTAPEAEAQGGPTSAESKPAEPAQPEAAAEPSTIETNGRVEQPSAPPLHAVLLMGAGFARPLWEMRLKAAGVAYAAQADLKPEQLAQARFEVLIETEPMASADAAADSPDRAPALASGGVLMSPCYVGSPTVMASEVGAMAGRVVGYTLFAPPRGEGEVEPIIEVARAMQTEDEAWARGLEFVRSLGFSPEIVGDAPGLVFGRMLAMLINEAAFALQAGIATAGDIDAAMKLGVNYPKGLLAWADELGLDFITQILDGLHAHYEEDRYRVAPALRHMILVGRKFDPAPTED